MLRPLYDRTVRSLKRAERDAFNAKLGLFSGCSSFMESDSAYPRKYADNGEKLAKTFALSTCLLYYRGYLVAADAGELLGEDVKPLREKAARLKDAINARFWLPEKGYYAYYIDADGKLDDRMEGLGEAFAILTGVADADRARQILRSTPTTPWGFPCLWPQYEEWRSYKTDFAHYYHNGMIWPFVRRLLGLGGQREQGRQGFRPRTRRPGQALREERHLHGALPPRGRQAGRLPAAVVERLGLPLDDLSRAVRHPLRAGRPAVRACRAGAISADLAGEFQVSRRHASDRRQGPWNHDRQVPARWPATEAAVVRGHQPWGT